MTLHKIQGVAEECLKSISVCNICEYDDTQALDLHHIIPVSEGGSDNIENLVILCANCHRIVHSNMKDNKSTGIKKPTAGDILDGSGIISADELNFKSFAEIGEPFREFLRIFGYSESRINTLTDPKNSYAIPMRKEKLSLFYTFYLGYMYAIKQQLNK